MFGLSTQRKRPIELRERATRLVVEARADTLTRRGAFTRIGGGLGACPQALRTRARCGAGRAPFRRPWTQRVVGHRHPLRARAGRRACVPFVANVHSRRPHPPRRAGVFPGSGGIDNVYSPAGRIHGPTTAGPDAKREEPGSLLLPSRHEPAHRTPEHHEPSTALSTIQRPTPIPTDNHNGYTQTITRVLR